MPTAATAAYGTLLKLGDGATPTEHFTTVAEVKNIQGPGLKTDTKDATSHTSAGAFHEYLATLKDGGEVKVTANFVVQNTTQNYTAGILKDYSNRTLRNYQIVFTDPALTTWTMPVYVVQYEPKAPVDGITELDVTLKISGQPTLA